MTDDVRGADDEERWRRADALLDAALDLPPGERAAFLDRECGDDHRLREQLSRLLSHAEHDETWMDPDELLTASLVDPAVMDENVDLTGTVVDRYRIVRELGRGGMAVVYLADRADGEFEQSVALKLIKRGIDTDEVVRRFQRERQILARILHPNIARLLDGGTTEDGRPFFAMEHIDGQPIDRYCDDRSLGVRQRLELFLRVAEAVAYAHRNLVVHRDIKPSNILVTADGEVKLLDFGIARLIRPRSGEENLTGTQQRILTPAFASPEQVQGQAVTTASDVYQLGLLLYLLLTGRHPHGGTTQSAERLAKAICNDPPTRPSTAVTARGEPEARHTSPRGLRRALRGDLDNIILTALRKEPERRYPSVAQLIEDVRHYLADRPVSARPDTLAYRTAKLVARHKLGTAFVASGLVALVVFAVAMAVQAGRISRERDRANREARAAEQVSEFLVGLFEVSDPEKAQGETITAREILDRGAAVIEQQLNDQPLVQARLMDTIGRVYQNLGLYDDAQPLIETALETRRLELGENDDEVATSLNNLAWLLEQKGQLDEAEPLYRRGLELRRELEGEPGAGVATSLNNLGLLYYRQGKFDQAERALREAATLRRRLPDVEDEHVADTLSNLALVLHRRGELDEAESLYVESLDLRRAALGESHPAVAISLDNLARLYFDRGDHERAEPLFREALAIRRKVYGESHPEVASSLNNLASFLYASGDLDGAEEMFRETVALDRRLLGDRHPDMANTLNNLGFILQAREKYGQAEAVYREAAGIYLESLGADHWLLGLARSNLGDCLTRLGRYEEAETELLEGRAVLAAALGEDNARVATATERLVQLYEAWGRTADAERYRRYLPPPESSTGP